MSRAKQSLQDRISTTNAGIFFREFSFSSTKFTPPDNTELELADHVVVIDGRLLIFQLKEREKPTKNESKKVVVIGSGATAVSLVPALARAAMVTMLQRSPGYLFSMPRVARWMQPKPVL